jgi:uncharacterized protein
LIVTPGVSHKAAETTGASARGASGDLAAAGKLPHVTLIHGADLVAAPWKNGGGVTREVAAMPPGAGLDAFIWRVSIADVAQAGPFSRFAGIDRTLVLLSGAGMLLDEAREAGDTYEHALTQPLDVARFAGEASIDARLVDGATRDFNLMVRRGAANGVLEIWRVDGGTQQCELSADVVLLFCADGSPQITLGDGAAVQLSRDDTLCIETPHALRCSVTGHGALLAISIRYA